MKESLGKSFLWVDKTPKISTIVAYFQNLTITFYQSLISSIFMVLPLIPIAIVGLGLAATGAAAYKFNIGGISDKTQQMLKGKRIAVLGGRGVGKTTLLHFLRTGKIQSSFEQTSIDDYKSFSFKVGNSELHVKGGHDIGGGHFQHSEWRKQIEESDIVFYLINIDKLLNKDTAYINDTKGDLNAIKDAIAEKKGKTAVFLIIIHADKQSDYSNNRQKFEEKVSRNNLIETAQIELGGSDHCIVRIGSLKDEESANQLLKSILMSYNAG